MLQNLFRMLIVGAGVAVFASASASASAASSTSKLEREIHQLNAVHEIQNLMTRYAQDNWNEQFDDLMEYIALDKPDVHINVPTPLVGGEAVRKAYEKRMEARAAGKTAPGIMHVHPNSSPFIEVAGDGQTAKGVFDSFGPDIGGPDSPGSLVYSRYAVDFIYDKGRWKIWHLQLFPVVSYVTDTNIVQSAKDRAAASSRSNAAPVLLPTGDGKTMPLWRYDSTGVTPANYPKLPKPYQTFDPKDSY